MNPGFSPAASSAVFHSSGFSPDFFKPLPPPSADAVDAVATADAADAADAAEGISYPQHAGETVAEFEKSPAFPRFLQEFGTHVERIQLFAAEHLGDEAHDVRVAFDDFSKKLFGDEQGFFEGEENILYGAGKRSLEQIAARLADEGIGLARRQTCVLELAAGIRRCAGGAAVNLAEAAQTLQSAHDSQFLRARDEAAKALITEAYRDLTTGGRRVGFTLTIGGKIARRVPLDFEIHCATSLRNAVADHLGLKKHADPIADNCVFSPEAIEYCLQYVVQRLTPAGLATQLAEEYLHAFRRPVLNALAQSVADNACSEPFSYRKWSGQLSNAREDLKHYGEIGMRSVVTPTDPHYRKVRLNADATLVALDILDEQRRNGALAAHYRPTTLMHWRHGENDISVEHFSGQLAWAVENGDAHLLDTKHLMLVAPKDFQGSEKVARLIVENVVRNTAPETLQACLSVEWLSILNTADVFSKWTPAALSRYLKRQAMHIAMLPRSRMLSIAKGIVACGKETDLGLCVQHGRNLFEPPANGALPPEFFRIALLRGDVMMFSALLARFEEGMSRSERIQQHAGIIIASANAQGVVATADAYLQHGHNPVLSAYYSIAIRAARNGLMAPALLENILAARNLRGTPGLVFAMQNNDCEKIRIFGATVMAAWADGLLDGAQCARLLNASTMEGAPALLMAIKQNHAEAIRTYGDIVAAAHARKTIDRTQVFALLATEILEDCSALAFAAALGNSAAVQALEYVFTLAVSKGALTGAQVHMLLQGPAALPQQLLEMTLCVGRLDAAVALGNLFLNLYIEDVLDRGQLGALLSGKTPASTQQLIDALAHGADSGAALDAMADIVVTAEGIVRQKEDLPALCLTAAGPGPSLDLTTLAVARSDAGLRALAADIRALHGQLQSGLAVCGHVRAQAKALERQMNRSRLALFFNPGDSAEGPRLFAEVEQAWAGLAGLL